MKKNQLYIINKNENIYRNNEIDWKQFQRERNRCFSLNIQLFIMSIVPAIIIGFSELNKDILFWRIRLFDLCDAVIMGPFWYLYFFKKKIYKYFRFIILVKFHFLLIESRKYYLKQNYNYYCDLNNKIEINSK